ncbi:MAG: hypothetical protein WCT23_00010 [Candidatus Neomarinimicrobiota bacterium]
MKKISMLLSLILIAILFSACTNDNDPDYAELLIGRWVNTMVNGREILTDDTFVMNLRSDNIQMYAIGLQEDENNKSWQENSNYTYSVIGDTICIDGFAQGNTFHMKFEIQSIDNSTISYTVPIFAINGDMIPDEKTYTCEKVTIDFSTEFTGIWYGRCTSPGTNDSLFHYWEYFADSTYNYYYQNENSKWIKKTDNEGQYFLYGQLMVSNYSYDHLSAGTGRAFECWNFNIDGNRMTWTGLRENNVTINYEMQKVESPPETE